MSTHQHSLRRRALLALFLLITGHWQLQHVVACSMMEQGVQEQCCCGARESTPDCIEAERGVGRADDTDQCCERSLEVTFDLEARQDSPVLGTGQYRFDLDPPTAIEPPVVAFAPPASHVVQVALWRHAKPRTSASDTYLVTRRLRI